MSLVKYFSNRWLNSPSAEGERFVRGLLEVAFGANAFYFIETTKACIDGWRGEGQVFSDSVLEGFVVTGDPGQDALIAHAVLVWTCINGEPWPEEVYHRWLDRLLGAGSEEVAYLAACLWPARGLMEKVRYRPIWYKVYHGQIDEDAERRILARLLREAWDWGVTGIYDVIYDRSKYNESLNHRYIIEKYIIKHGFNHRICGLVPIYSISDDNNIYSAIKSALSASCWSEGVREAAALLYISLKWQDEIDGFLGILPRKILDLIERKMDDEFKEEQKSLLEFFTGKENSIEYNLLRKFINHILVIDKNINNSFSTISSKERYYMFKRKSFKRFRRYIINGLKSSDIIIISKHVRDIIFNIRKNNPNFIDKWLYADNRFFDIFINFCIGRLSEYYKVNLSKRLKINDFLQKISDLCRGDDFIKIIHRIIKQSNYFEEGDVKEISGIIFKLIEKEKSNVDIYKNIFIEDMRAIIMSRFENSIEFKVAGGIKDYLKFSGAKHIGLNIYYYILEKWITKFDDIRKDERYANYLYSLEYIRKIFNPEFEENIINKTEFYIYKIKNKNFNDDEEESKIYDDFFNMIFKFSKDIKKDYEIMRSIRKMVIEAEESLRNVGLITTIFRMLEIENNINFSLL